MATEEERKKKFEEDITKKINELPLEIRIKALALRNYLNEKNALDEQLDKETIQMHKKFEDLSEPFYKKSGDIVDGKLPVPEESVADLDNYVTEAEKEAATAAKGASPLKEYWFKALKNCDSIAQEIREKDFDALKHLVKIDIIKDGNEKDFILVFQFTANEFFSNETLSKRFFMKDADTPERSEGTEIQWKDGKNLTKKQVKKKQKNKKSGQQRVVTKEVDDESFFNFFKTINVDEKELEKIEDDEEVEKIQERMDIDFEISQVILDELYPYSLEYFLGVKEAFGDDLHDLEHEDHEDEEVEQEEAPKPKKKKNKKKKNAQKEGDAPGPSQNPGQKPECAQSQT